MAAKNQSGQKLKTLREMAGLTQSEVGLRFGVDRSVLSLVESGFRELDEDQQARIEKYLTQAAQRRFDGVCVAVTATA